MWFAARTTTLTVNFFVFSAHTAVTSSTVVSCADIEESENNELELHTRAHIEIEMLVRTVFRALLLCMLRWLFKANLRVSYNSLLCAAGHKNGFSFAFSRIPKF